MDQANEYVVVSVKPVRNKIFQIECTLLYNAYDSAVYEVEASGPNEALRLFQNWNQDHVSDEPVHQETYEWDYIEAFRHECTIDNVKEVDGHRV